MEKHGFASNIVASFLLVDLFCFKDSIQALIEVFLFLFVFVLRVQGLDTCKSYVFGYMINLFKSWASYSSLIAWLFESNRELVRVLIRREVSD